MNKPFNFAEYLKYPEGLVRKDGYKIIAHCYALGKVLVAESEGVGIAIYDERHAKGVFELRTQPEWRRPFIWNNDPTCVFLMQPDCCSWSENGPSPQGANWRWIGPAYSFEPK